MGSSDVDFILCQSDDKAELLDFLAINNSCKTTKTGRSGPRWKDGWGHKGVGVWLLCEVCFCFKDMHVFCVTNFSINNPFTVVSVAYEYCFVSMTKASITLPAWSWYTKLIVATSVGSSKASSKQCPKYTLWFPYVKHFFVPRINNCDRDIYQEMK